MGVIQGDTESLDYSSYTSGLPRKEDSRVERKQKMGPSVPKLEQMLHVVQDRYDVGI